MKAVFVIFVALGSGDDVKNMSKKQQWFRKKPL
jgi:hypothetical protein